MVDHGVTHAQASHELIELQHEIYTLTRGGKRPARYLMLRLTDRRNLHAAWQRVRRASGANTPGPDGMTCKAIAPHIEELLDELTHQLTHLRYRPGKINRIQVPKGPGRPGTRTLSLLNVKDRIVHAAIKQVLEPVLEPRFDRRSYGYRPGRSVVQAAAALCRRLERADQVSAEFSYVANVDVADCFDSIDIDILLDRLGRYVEDKRFLAIVRCVLSVAARKVGWLNVRRVGIPQGSPLSPLLCNLYLHELDQALAKVSYEYGGFDFFRYADDLILMGSSRIALRRGLRTLRSTLKALGLRMKTGVRIERMDEGFEWLGLRFVPRRRPWFDGVRFACEIPPHKVVEMFERVNEMTVPPSQRLDPDVFDLGRWIASLNKQLKQWAAVYRNALNAREVFMDLDDHVFDRVGQLIKSVTDLSMAQVRDRYVVELPRGFRTYEVNGERLVVLATLPPARRERSVQKPAWMSRPDRPTGVAVQSVPVLAGPASSSFAAPEPDDIMLSPAQSLPPSSGEADVKPAAKVEPEEPPFDTELAPVCSEGVTAGFGSAANEADLPSQPVEGVAVQS